jgi:long-chain acyl-CoA synthetase
MEKDNMKFHTLKEMIDGINKDAFGREAFNMTFGEKHLKITYEELQNDVRALSNILLKMGVKKDDKIGIFSENRLEWPLVYLGVACAGAVIVPIDIFMTVEELGAVIKASDIKILFTSGEFIEKIKDIMPETQNLKQIVCFDEHEQSDKLTADIAKKEYNKKQPFKENEYIYYPALLNAGKLLFQNGIDRYTKKQINPDDIAAMVFMHDTVFALLSHKAIMSNLYGVFVQLSCNGKYLRKGERWLATLPFHHTYPITFDILIPLAIRMTIRILTKFKPKDIICAINESNINYCSTVPLILENIYKSIKSEGTNLGNLKFLMVGGAPVHKNILKSVSDLGIHVCQGLGLTEHAPAVFVTKPDFIRLGSCGHVLCNTEAKIINPDKHGNGKILAKGPCVMRGYYKKPNLTKKVIDKDGWLHTGDIGRIDEDGFLFVTGRSKNIIVNKGGKNIYPKEIEQALIKSDYISSALVMPKIDSAHGEYPHAVIYPDFKAISKMEKETKQRFSDQKIRQIIKDEIRKTTERMSHYKRPVDFEITHEKIEKIYSEKKPFMFENAYSA